MTSFPKSPPLVVWSLFICLFCMPSLILLYIIIRPRETRRPGENLLVGVGETKRLGDNLLVGVREILTRRPGDDLLVRLGETKRLGETIIVGVVGI